MSKHHNHRASSRPTTSGLSRRQIILGSAAGVAVGALPGSSALLLASAQSATPAAGAEESGEMIDIGVRFLYFESAGVGEPTVVLEAGALGRSDVWSRDLQQPVGERELVFPAVSEFTHVVTYDRPGTIGEVNSSLDPSAPLFYPSRSDPVPQPRTIEDVAIDLRALLKAANVPPPYVLVGHSLGGMVVRLYANTYPDDVVGMVLVDATPVEINVEFANALSPEAWAEFEALSGDNPELRAAYLEYERLTAPPLLENPNASILREAQARSPLRPMPLVVLSHGLPFAAPFPAWSVETMEGIMSDQQQTLVDLVPNARHVIAEKSGHNIHQDQPELVIRAIRDVVDAVRDPSTW